MQNILMHQTRSRNITGASLLLMLQSVSWLACAGVIFALDAVTLWNAPSESGTSTVAFMAAFGGIWGGFFLFIGISALLIAWDLWRQKVWALRNALILEGCCLFICLATIAIELIWFRPYYNAIVWPPLLEEILTIAILVCLFSKRLRHR